MAEYLTPFAIHTIYGKIWFYYRAGMAQRKKILYDDESTTDNDSPDVGVALPFGNGYSYFLRFPDKDKLKRRNRNLPW